MADCNLDEFHEHIQTAMGWTNSHLHRFKIDGDLYGDPMLMGAGFGESHGVDSTRILISTILPKSGERFKFVYEYDFGDSWNHDILFEGCLQKKSGKRYPLCLEGERACPPEDVGGIDGFRECLNVIANPNHKQHDEFMKWAGDFEPETFDAKRVTNRMRKGVLHRRPQ